MKKTTLFLFIQIVFISCSSNINKRENNTKEEINLQIPFTEATGYFVKNTYNEIGVKKITTSKEFNYIFGTATTMKENGIPTKINFSTSYIIAIIGNKSDKKPEIKVDTLVQEGSNISLRYSIKENNPTSYFIRPVILLIINNKYEGNLIAEKIN